MTLDVSQKIRSALARFRTSSHELEIEKSRHNNIPRNERYCKLCLRLNLFVIEDEYHVLLKCPFYMNFKNEYVTSLATKPVNVNTFATLMATTDTEELVKLALFVSNMFQVRKLLLNTI